MEFNKIKNSVTSRIKSYLKNDSDNESKIYNDNRALSAKNAYMRAKYGRSLSQKDLLQKFFASANELVAAKSLEGTYCCMIEIDNDIKEFTPKIIKHFQEKLGYKLAIIDNETEIVEKHGSEPVKLQPNSTFLILMWNTPHITEEIFKEEYVVE